MVKYITNGKMTKAVLNDCEYDAARKIDRRFRAMTGDNSSFVFAPLIEKSMMRNKYSGTVKCDEQDEYNSVIGEQLALEKAQKNYQDGLKRAIKRWQKAMLRVIDGICENSFKEAVEEYLKER